MADCLLCERSMEDGYLCVGCTKDTRVHLESMPALYDGLEDLLAPSSGSPTLGRTSTGGYPPLPISEDVLDQRGEDGMVRLLESWLDAIRTERGWRAAAHPGSPTGRVRRASVELLGHLPWVAVSWPEAGTFAAEIRDLAGSVGSMIQPKARDKRIGNCPAKFDDGGICGAALRLPAGAKVVVCEWCRTTYPEAMWPGLKALMDVDAKANVKTNSQTNVTANVIRSVAS
ncbi:hypothetical protein KQY30_24835 [Streptomyces sp. GMY02]|uniref:hypothetical protein n=1 Tax=Streptomyces sp. GMY02 TaxID=1333528 RepID=UPI001C2C5C8C|nr:hypothetical protein [Streptomyces sp. GMY02]QXE36954.1 hypothetical protein KQY30_24835 [Streptomyces sp. GMY02]